MLRFGMTAWYHSLFMQIMIQSYRTLDIIRKRLADRSILNDQSRRTFLCRAAAAIAFPSFASQGTFMALLFPHRALTDRIPESLPEQIALFDERLGVLLFALLLPVSTFLLGLFFLGFSLGIVCFF